MSKKTLLFTVLLIVGGFLLGRLLGHLITQSDLKSKLDAANVKVLEQQRDSLKSLFNASVLREQKHILQHEQDSLKADSLVKSITKRESRIKTREQRVSEIERIVISQPDSFLIRRYPE